MDLKYVCYLILCVSICWLIVYKTAEAGIVDWLLGGTKTIVIINEPPKITYKLGDKIPIEYVRGLISQYATGTKAYEMERTIACESQYWNVQSNVISRGLREDSWGIAQINLYWNPSVTKEQALDPEFAIKWMSERWGVTKWYGWNRTTNSCNPIYI